MKKIILIIALVVIGLLVWKANENSPTRVFDGETFKIGIVIGLTDWTAYWGEDAKRGIDLAVEEINKEGGINGKKLETIYEDFGPVDLKLAASGANKLVNVDNVNVLFSSWLEDTTVVSPIAHKADVPLISLAAGNKGVSDTEYLFRIRPYFEGVFPKVSAEYFLKKWNDKPVILYEKLQYYQNYRDEISDTWEKINGYRPESFAIVGDARTILAEAKSKGYNLMYVVAPAPTEIKVMKSAQELGFSVPIIGAGEIDPVLISAGDLTEGMILYDYKTSDLVNFTDFYKEKYGLEPGSPSQWGYDAVYAVYEAVKNRGTSTRDIIEGLKKVNFEGASGIVQFTTDRNRIMDIDRIRINVKRNGKFIPVTD